MVSHNKRIVAALAAVAAMGIGLNNRGETIDSYRRQHFLDVGISKL